MAEDLRILLVDDHHLFRSGLKFLLEDLSQNISFLEADSVANALTKKDSDPVDLVLLDFHLPDSDGDFASLHRIKETFEEATVVVLSSEDDPGVIRGAVDAGAGGFIPKSSTPDIMIAALKLVLAGGVYLPRNAMSHAATIKEIKAPEASEDQSVSDTHAAEVLKSQLSDRQLEVLMGAIRGKPNKIIARELNIAEGTVKAHLSVAFRILDVRNRTEALFVAAKYGLVI